MLPLIERIWRQVHATCTNLWSRQDEFITYTPVLIQKCDGLLEGDSGQKLHAVKLKFDRFFALNFKATKCARLCVLHGASSIASESRNFPSKRASSRGRCRIFTQITTWGRDVLQYVTFFTQKFIFVVLHSRNCVTKRTSKVKL